MKTLYVSDLDGTLLNDHTAIDPPALQKLNHWLTEGLCFSVATGRSLTVARHILSPMALTLPVLLLNGVHIYDNLHHKTVAIHEMERGVIGPIMDRLSYTSLCSVLYVMRADGNVTLYYQNGESPLARRYLESRAQGFKPYVNYPAVLPKEASEVLNRHAVCFLIILGASETDLLPVQSYINTIPDLNCHLYKENGTNFVSLEVFSSQGGKDKGIAFLQKQTQAKKVISFGDNLNDLAMKKQSDLFCVVENALDELKNQADWVIKSNNEAGVIQFIGSRQTL